MHHLPDDRPGPDDRHLHDEVVELLRLQPRQRRHLRARLDLEDADRVGLAEHLVDGRVLRQMREIDDQTVETAELAELAEKSCSRVLSVSAVRVSPLTSASESWSTAIMPRPSRSTLTMPMSAQSSLSHCTTTRPGMLAFSSGTHGVELSLADHHAAGVLAEMPRQILHLAPEPREQAGRAIRVQIEADRRHLPRQRVARIDELEVVHHLRQPIDLRRIEAERLPHLARRAAAAIGDDVGGHRRAEPAVFLVDVLDHLLAAIAARQIEIDVGPLAALLRQEALEQQIHPHRIDRGDPEAVADGAVGRRPAPLHEDVVLPAEIDDVPDDEEVAGELELLDEIELARDLRARAVVIRPVALARADVGDLAQERALRFAGRHRVVGKAVAEIGHRVLQAIGELARARDRAGMIAEQRRHLGRRLQVALGVRREAAARRRRDRCDGGCR